jgi:RimJ/RimL family protein N-acetyltransferase
MDFNFNQEIILEDERVQLRPLVLSDVDNLLAVATSDEKLVQYSPKPVHTKELLTQYIESALADKLTNDRYPFIIFDKHHNAYAGSTSYLFVSNYNRRLEIGGTWSGKSFQKTGLNRHCKFLLLSYAFDELGFERVEFKTDERNLASRAAIEKTGGKFEGILRSHTLMDDGFRRNTVCYSILKNEWPQLKEDLQRSMQ